MRRRWGEPRLVHSGVRGEGWDEDAGRDVVVVVGRMDTRDGASWSSLGRSSSAGSTDRLAALGVAAVTRRPGHCWGAVLTEEPPRSLAVGAPAATIPVHRSARGDAQAEDVVLAGLVPPECARRSWRRVPWSSRWMVRSLRADVLHARTDVRTRSGATAALGMGDLLRDEADGVRVGAGRLCTPVRAVPAAAATLVGRRPPPAVPADLGELGAAGAESATGRSWG